MPKQYFRVVYINQAQTLELKAQSLFQSEMPGFIEVEDFLFDDEDEHPMRAELEGVKRSYIPITSIVRIDEIDKRNVSTQGLSSVSKVTPLRRKQNENQDV